MAKFVIECFDERGDRLEAHCEQSSGDPHYRFTVEVISETRPARTFSPRRTGRCAHRHCVA